MVLQHGLAVPVCPRGSQGVAIVLSTEAADAWKRVGEAILPFGDRILATRLHLLDDRGNLVHIFLV